MFLVCLPADNGRYPVASMVKQPEGNIVPVLTMIDKGTGRQFAKRKLKRICRVQAALRKVNALFNI